MKNILNLIFVLLLGLIACNKQDTNISEQELGFEESVAIIQYGINSDKYKTWNKQNEEPAIIEIKNFNPDFTIQSQYYIDGIQYTDDGSFNDEIPNDGYYTSIKKYPIDDLKSFFQNNDALNKSDAFMFNKELNSYLLVKYGKSVSKNKSTNVIELTCKVRLAQCPETDWWNSCWPLSSPCTCVEYYDCEVKVEI